MINYRLPWYTLLAGGILILGATVSRLEEPFELALVLSGIILMLDGGFGLRILPQLTPFASFPEDWRMIEHHLYFGTQGKLRWAAIWVGCAAIAVGSAILEPGDWSGWCAILLIIASGIIWIFAALSAIRQVLANDS